MTPRENGAGSGEVGPAGAWSALPGERFSHGEGARLVDGHVYLVDIVTGRLLRLPADLAGPPIPVLDLDVPLGAVAPSTAGDWVVAAGTGIARLPHPRPSAAPAPAPAAGPEPEPVAGGRPGTGGSPGSAVRGEPDWWGRPEDSGGTGERPETRMNDAAADPSGRFWATSMAYDESSGAGTLYRVDGPTAVVAVAGGFTVPNGPVFTPDGATMYLSDSARQVIYRYRLDPATGDPAERTEFAHVDEGHPDGMALDDEGGLWSAIFGGGQVRRYAPDGRLDLRLELPARQPTSVCLAGGRLFVTTAAKELDDPGPHDGAVLHTPVPFTAPPAAAARC